MSENHAGETRTANLFLDYPKLMEQAIERLAKTLNASPDAAAFAPGYVLPEPDEKVRRFADVATATWQDAGGYRGCRLSLLDLTGNPGSNTEKTLAAILMVARAVEHIRRTGEHILMFTPTSANKGTALRDAVWRAIWAGLVSPEQLRIATLVPQASLGKLRESQLTANENLRVLNPLLVYTGPEPENVKPLGREFADVYAKRFPARQGTNFWYSLEYRNYVIADTLRAFFEHAMSPPEHDDQPRIHAHSVSSAYGLLGYHSGRDVLEDAGVADIQYRPQSLLVQHLRTPYMVLHLLNRSFDKSAMPRYEFDAGTALYRRVQEAPNFPEVCYEPDEQIDPTFYTHNPPTSPAMDEVVDRFGGNGIVVSLPECVERYPRIRARLADTGHTLPADFRTLREWSTVMAFTGVLNAIDRHLIPEDMHVVVTGSGSYSTSQFIPLNPRDAVFVSTPEEIAEVLDVSG